MLHIFVSVHFFVSVDREAPKITCLGNQSIEADEDMPTALFTWKTPETSDNSGNVPVVSCYPQSGSYFTIGQTIVTCEADDGHRNKANCSFQVNVIGI